MYTILYMCMVLFTNAFILYVGKKKDIIPVIYGCTVLIVVVMIGIAKGYYS